jgi:hypothetical protein
MYPCRAGAAFTSASLSMHTVVTQQATCTRSIVSLLLKLKLFKTPHEPLGPRNTEAALALALD